MVYYSRTKGSERLGKILYGSLKPLTFFSNYVYTTLNIFR